MAEKEQAQAQYINEIPSANAELKDIKGDAIVQVNNGAGEDQAVKDAIMEDSLDEEVIIVPVKFEKTVLNTKRARKRKENQKDKPSSAKEGDAKDGNQAPKKPAEQGTDDNNQKKCYNNNNTANKNKSANNTPPLRHLKMGRRKQNCPQKTGIGSVDDPATQTSSAENASDIENGSLNDAQLLTSDNSSQNTVHVGSKSPS